MTALLFEARAHGYHKTADALGVKYSPQDLYDPTDPVISYVRFKCN